MSEQENTAANKAGFVIVTHYTPATGEKIIERVDVKPSAYEQLSGLVPLIATLPLRESTI